MPGDEIVVISVKTLRIVHQQQIIHDLLQQKVELRSEDVTLWHLPIPCDKIKRNLVILSLGNIDQFSVHGGLTRVNSAP